MPPRCHSRVLAEASYLQEHRHIPSDKWGDDAARVQVDLRMPIAYGDFRSRFSLRSRRGYHASKLEAGALTVAMRIVTRSARCHRQRLLFLVDAKAFLYAARKGRSTAPNFVQGLCGIAAHALAADLKLHFGYIPTRYSPGDPPSRGLGLHNRRKSASSVSGPMRTRTS